MRQRPVVLRRHAARVWAGVLLFGVVWFSTDVYHRAAVIPGQPERHHSDFTVYTAAAEAFATGQDAYETTNVRGWHYLYPPLFALLLLPTGGLRPEHQAALWFWLNYALAVGVFGLSRRILVHAAARRSLAGCGEEHVPWWLCGGAFLAVLPATIDCLQRGQVSVWLLFWLLFGYVLLVVSDRPVAWWFGALALALSVATKVTPLLPVGFLLLQLLRACSGPADRRRAVTGVAGVAVGLGLFLFVLPASYLGWQGNLRALATWRDKVVGNADLGEHAQIGIGLDSNQSLSNAVPLCARWLRGRLGLSAAAVEQQAQARQPGVVVQGWRLLLLFGLLATLGWLAPGDELGRAAAFGLACVATLMLSPLSWSHHYVLWFPACLFLPLWLWQYNRRAAVWMATVPWVVNALHHLCRHTVGPMGLLGLTTATWMLVAYGLIWRVTRSAGYRRCFAGEVPAGATDAA